MSASNKIVWDDGKLITLTEDSTASCQRGLEGGQLYCLFFYNSAPGDATATVEVVWSNSAPPVRVKVPGTTGDQGLAAICFVSGDDTNTISVSVGQEKGAKIQAFIGSVKMPTNPAGINNLPMPLDGQAHALTRFTRFYCVPESHWYTAQLQSNVNQFISVQLSEDRAIVNIVNAAEDPEAHITYVGKAKEKVKVNTARAQTVSWELRGNGRQTIWINADSVQNSQSATLSLQSLAR